MKMSHFCIAIALGLTTFTCAAQAPAPKPAPPAHKPVQKSAPMQGVALTPPMGWNSWNYFAGKVTDQDIRNAADGMVSSGMKDAGYVYINIDDTWEGARDADGVLHTNSKFPDMKALADYVHSKGLKLGIYSSPWVPMGVYACGTTLYIGAGTWLLLSPGAIIKRIQHPTSPAVMICNYKPGAAAAAGNIKITGGTFDAVGSGLTQNCAIMSFVNASNIRVEDLIMNQVANGYSPYAQIFGCSDVWIEDIDFQGGNPSGGRTYQQHPCVRVECTHPTNIAGLVSGDYSGYPMCRNITVRHCNLTANTATDSVGAYSAWTSLVGTIGINGGGYHERITVVNNVGAGFSLAGICGNAWDRVVYNSNSMSYPPQPYILIGGGSSDINIEGNSASSFLVSPVSGAGGGSTLETIVLVFTIPSNDWCPGTSGYSFSCNGQVVWVTNCNLTIRVYIGTNANTSDYKACGDIVHAHTGSGSGLWNIKSNDIHIDSSGQWWPGGWRYTSQNAYEKPGYQFFSPPQGQTLYITVTAQWSNNSAYNAFSSSSGNCQRLYT